MAIVIAPNPLPEPAVTAWTRKDVQMYEEVRDRERETGRSHDRAEMIARREVEEKRVAEGRAPAIPLHEPKGPSDRLEEQTRDELYDRAKELNVGGRSRMTKEQLMEAIRANAKK